jgi:hypothetical protein
VTVALRVDEAVVDDGEIAFVVQETFVGRDLGVDANPEVHVVLDAGRARDLRLRMQRQRRREHQRCDGEQNRPREGLGDCRAHLHSLARTQLVDHKMIASNGLRVMSPLLRSVLSKILTARTSSTT